MTNDLPPASKPGEEWRPGAMAYRSQDGQWHVANPHSSLYSTLTMLATHYWTGTEWRLCDVG